MTAPPRLPRINSRRDRHALSLRHHAGIGPPERAIQKPRIVGDVVHRGQHHSVQPVQLHDIAETRDAVIVFRSLKGQSDLVAIVEPIEFRAFSFSHRDLRNRGGTLARTPKGPGVQDDSGHSPQAIGVPPCGDAIATARAAECAEPRPRARGIRHAPPLAGNSSVGARAAPSLPVTPKACFQHDGMPPRNAAPRTPSQVTRTINRPQPLHSAHPRLGAALWCEGG
ncbi:hypothetical protein GALL_472280 [mine drainage metagenome]|uniref:Uncharacterized protein n=1 Tax=mine drainage metagenome TaxID=410659 RepID=A0A1J5PI54_9ZZZZ